MSVPSTQSVSCPSLDGIPLDVRSNFIFARLRINDIKRLREVCRQFREEIDKAHQLLTSLGCYPLNRVTQITWVKRSEFGNNNEAGSPYNLALTVYQSHHGENRNWVRDHHARNRMIDRMQYRIEKVKPERLEPFQSFEFRRECLLTSSGDGYYALVEDEESTRVYGTRNGAWVGIANLSENPTEDKPIWKFFSRTHLVQIMTKKSIEFCHLLNNKTLFRLSTDSSFGDDSTKCKQGLFLIKSERRSNSNGIDVRTIYTCWNSALNKSYQLPHCTDVSDFITHDGATYFLMHQSEKGGCTLLLTYHWDTGNVEMMTMRRSPTECLTHNRFLLRTDQTFEVLDQNCMKVFNGDVNTSELPECWRSNTPGIPFRLTCRSMIYSEEFQFLFISEGSEIMCYDVKGGHLVKTITIPVNYQAFELRLWDYQFAVFYHAKDDAGKVECSIWNMSEPSSVPKKKKGPDIQDLVNAHHDQGILVSIKSFPDAKVHATFYDLLNLSVVKIIKLENYQLWQGDRIDRKAYFVNGLLVDVVWIEHNLRGRKTMTTTNIYNYTDHQFTVGNLELPSKCVIS